MPVMGGEIEFKAYAPEQGHLLPSYTAEALDPSDPAFFVDEVVEGLDLRGFERRYSALGERAYPPRMLLKLWLFAAIAGVYSGREIARRVHYDLRFRYLAGELRPDFRTINRFRRVHIEDFREVFRQTVRIARQAGLAKLGRVAIDGTKLRANTSRHKAMSRGRMDEAEAQLDDEIAQILMQIEEQNAAEDEEHGDDDGGGGLPAELQSREARRERIRAARAQLEREKGEKLEDRHQKSFADLDANMMKTGEGSLTYCYNAQAAVSEDGILVATELSTTPRDEASLEPVLEAIEANTGERPERVLADKGYLTEPTLRAMEMRRQKCLIAVGREGKPAKWPKRSPLTRKMHRTLRLPWAQELYRHRKTQGERPFAVIKGPMGFRRFMLRTKRKARGEWDLVAAAFNLTALWRAQPA
jgi:transposase